MTSYPTYPVEPQPSAAQSQVPQSRVPSDQRSAPPAEPVPPGQQTMPRAQETMPPGQQPGPSAQPTVPPVPETAHVRGPLPGGPIPAAGRPPGRWPAASAPTLSVPRDRHHEDPSYRAPDIEHDPTSVYWPPASEDDRIWAMMAYLGVIFFAFLPPLTAYLVKHRESPFVRYHAVQALNLWVTVFLYSVSFLIIGVVLTFDAVSAALAVAVPLMAAAAIVMLVFVVLSALAAARGEPYRIPAWLCARLLK